LGSILKIDDLAVAHPFCDQFFRARFGASERFCWLSAEVFDLLGEPLALLRRSANLTKPAQAVREQPL
jgi:hypothetical protein